MTIKYVSGKPVAAEKRPSPPRVDLTLPGRLRADDVQAILRIGRTWLYKGIATGKYPPPDYVEGRIRYWKHSTILKLLEGGTAIDCNDAAP
ncbi:hypothetical protein [Caballeronia sp. ATUFL_M2_KS44]|uniref:helix-turn-helix transcriptional regulator n=1 Tax=Caballeronia sp. ATUFL_M2_KS44 TaxID=2921767 RepID=UPI0020294F49|nr:hypothetical protein [Caballeronia sp. ATUFL_M2_KS44]